MTREVKAAARALARAVETAREGEGSMWGDTWGKGRRAMRIGKDDILEAIGLQSKGSFDWLGHAAIGFGVGAVVGAAVALMVAPRSGEELREELLDKGRRIVQRGRETAEEYKGSTQTRPSS